ncbi:LytR/AlgR family response regulator transcription factor [Aquiflexum sp.]|uniref:LytR/AlgR family response regulator transcription factor n=1 Tax=Aquiflexum sp. TaxID=1872584 RepID=UPI003593128D
MIRAIIIDDEPKSIQSLEWDLNFFSDQIHIVGTFVNVIDAIRKIEVLQPDVVFLDIEMPEMDGFQFLEYFKDRKFEVVFVTAYAEHAIQAIKERALDYLLKPIEKEDLSLAVQKISQNKKKRDLAEVFQDEKLVFQGTKLKINSDDKMVFLDPADIVYCESDGSYSRIITENNDEVYISKKLKYLEEMLPTELFYRIHNSYLINLQKVNLFEKGTSKVVLVSGISLPVSRSKKSGFLSRF